MTEEEAFGQWWAAHSTKARPERMFDAVKVVWQAAWRDATAAERERCAKVCESRQTPGTGSVAILNGAADAIRNG